MLTRIESMRALSQRYRCKLISVRSHTRIEKNSPNAVLNIVISNVYEPRVLLDSSLLETLIDSRSLHEIPLAGAEQSQRVFTVSFLL